MGIYQENILDKSNPPTSFGVFKPVGHTLIAFYKADERQAAQEKLSGLGFAPSSMVVYTAAEMQAQVDAEMLAKSPMANFGYELELVRLHGDLAQKGCSFLVVDAPTEALAEQVAGLVRAIQPATAQHYGRFMIEDLTEEPPGRMQDRDAHPV